MLGRCEYAVERCHQPRLAVFLTRLSGLGPDCSPKRALHIHLRTCMFGLRDSHSAPSTSYCVASPKDDLVAQFVGLCSSVHGTRSVSDMVHFVEVDANQLAVNM